MTTDTPDVLALREALLANRRSTYTDWWFSDCLDTLIAAVRAETLAGAGVVEAPVPCKECGQPWVHAYHQTPGPKHHEFHPATPPTPALTAAGVAEAMREQHRPVPYHWTQSGERGTVCHGSTVGLHHRVELWPCDVERAILAALAVTPPTPAHRKTASERDDELEALTEALRTPPTPVACVQCAHPESQHERAYYLVTDHRYRPAHPATPPTPALTAGRLDLDRLAAALVATTPTKDHGQLCPVWVRRHEAASTAPQSKAQRRGPIVCDCFVSRGAPLAAAHLAAQYAAIATSPAPEVERWECGCVADRWSDDLPPGGVVCGACGQPVESEPCAEHQPGHADHAMPEPTGPCIFAGCVATWKHWHGGFPGGYDNPADPHGPPIPFTDPDPEPSAVRDHNGAALPKERCAECGHEARWHMDGACACEGDGIAGLCPCPMTGAEGDR